MSRFLMSGAISIMTGVFATAAGPSTVTGTMTVNGVKTELHHVMAVAAPSMFFKDNRKDLVLVFSDVPVSADDVVNDRLWTLWRDGKLSALLLRIQPWDKQVVSGNLFAGNLAKKGQTISGNGMAGFIPTKFAADLVEGRISKHNYGDKELSLSVDATFSAAIEGGPLDFTDPEPAQPPAPAAKKMQGTPLPAGGGEPGAAYLAFVKALHAGNVPAVRKAFFGSNESAAQIKELIPMLQELTPKDSQVTGGVSDGKSAELDVTSSHGKETVRMVHDKDGWKVTVGAGR